MKKFKLFLGMMIIVMAAVIIIPGDIIAQESCPSDGSKTAITVKPKNINEQYNIRTGDAYIPNDFEITSGSLISGDEIVDVIYGGSQAFTGSSNSSIVSLRIMRGDVDVTNCYSIIKEQGEIKVTTFGLPAPSEELRIAVGREISVSELENLIRITGITPTHSGVGSYNQTTGFTSNEVGTATLVYIEAGQDLGGDSELEISPLTFEVEITVFAATSNSYTLTYNANGGIGTMNSETLPEGSKVLEGTQFTAPAGKRFAGWSLTADGYTIPSIDMTENKTLYAIWEDDTYSVSVDGGTARVDGNEKYTVLVGETVVLNSSGAPAGKEFDRWELTGVSVADLTQGEISFVMPANEVSAKAIYKDITATSPKEDDFLDNSGEQTFKPGKLTEYKIRIDADYRTFVNLYIDDVLYVKDTDYTVSEGSTVINFTKEGLRKLNALTEGEYDVVVEFTNNRVVSGKITLSNSFVPVNPQTLDNGIIGYIIITIISILGLIGLILLNKKRIKNM